MATKQILLVDDEPSIRLLLRRFLEPARYQVSEAGSAEAAFAAVESVKPDLVILDLGMPGLSGHEVLKRLKSQPGFRTPVMVLTAQTDWDSADASVAQGADAYMTKPLTRDQLLAKVEELLGPTT